MELLINISKKENISTYKKVGAKAFLFGLKGYNVNANSELDLAEIKNIIENDPDIELFISVDKNIFNSELDDLTTKLKQLSKLNIKGVLFYDLSILNIARSNNLDIDLVWNQTHMVTNYKTSNYYYEKNVKYGYLSSELTIDEVLQINNKSAMEFMVFLIGYPVLSHSRRTLLTNYYKSNGNKNDNNYDIVTERDNKYIIKENYTGTSILGGDIVNGSIYIDLLMENNIVYSILSDFMIDENVFIKVLENISKYIINKNKKYLENIETLIGNNTHFFNKKTIYKVKKE